MRTASNGAAASCVGLLRAADLHGIRLFHVEHQAPPKAGALTDEMVCLRMPRSTRAGRWGSSLASASDVGGIPSHGISPPGQSLLCGRFT